MPDSPPSFIRFPCPQGLRPIALVHEDGLLIGKPFIDVMHGKYRMRAVSHASQIVMRDPTETFHEFVLAYFAGGIARDWLAEERKKEPVRQHPVAAWVNEYFLLRRNGTPDRQRRGTWSMEISGNVRALLALAWDFYTVAHCAGPLLPKMLKRLRNRDQFQGARHEVAVAAIALRAGFDIPEWLRGSSKHVEFIGVHHQTRERVAFEAKSHHREGILGQAGTFDPEATRIKVLTHIQAAVSQAPKDLPLIVFDDLNLPMTPNVRDGEKQWFKDLDESFQRHGAAMEELAIESPFAGAFLTNFAWHFLGSSVGTPRQNELTRIWSPNGKYRVRPDTLDALQLAAEQYGHVPARLHERAHSK